jgi:hypothetical protein
MGTEIDRIVDRILAEDRGKDPLGIPPDATPLEALVAIYRSPKNDQNVRFKAIAEAAKYMHPRLAVTGIVNEQGLAYRLERAIERSEKAKNGIVPQNGVKLIEAKPIRRL